MLTALELFDLTRPGDVVFTRGKGFDPIGHLLQSLMGGGDWSHACLIGRAGSDLRPKIWTTGAQWGLRYGQVDAETYLKNKHYAICRFQPPEQVCAKKIEEYCEKQTGEFYPFHKVLALGVANWVNPNTLANPLRTWGHGEFCSQGVADALEAAGCKLTYKEEEIDRSAIDPRTLFNALNLKVIYDSENPIET